MNRRMADGRHIYCLACSQVRDRARNPKRNKAHLLKGRYGLRPAEREVILAGQNGLCARRRGPVVGIGNLDHDHKLLSGRQVLWQVPAGHPVRPLQPPADSRVVRHPSQRCIPLPVPPAPGANPAAGPGRGGRAPEKAPERPGHKQKEDPMTEPQATQVDPVRETLVKDLEYVSRKSTIREAMGGAMMPREVYDYPVEMRTQHRTSSLRTITPTPAPRRPSGEPTMKASCKSCGRRSRTCAKQARPTRTSWPSWPARSTSNDQLRRVRDRV